MPETRKVELLELEDISILRVMKQVENWIFENGPEDLIYISYEYHDHVQCWKAKIFFVQ
jgi:hypothetical protein